MPDVLIRDLTDEQKAFLEKKKGDMTWKEFLLKAPETFKEWQKINHASGDYIVRESDGATLQNVGSDKQLSIPVHPNQIMVYTLYTLEKVE